MSVRADLKPTAPAIFPSLMESNSPFSWAAPFTSATEMSSARPWTETSPRNIRNPRRATIQIHTHLAGNVGGGDIAVLAGNFNVSVAAQHADIAAAASKSRPRLSGER